MTKKLKLTNSARRWGYVMWGPGELRRIEFKNFFKNAGSVSITLNGEALPRKRNIDYKYGRISLGPKTMRKIPASASYFELSFAPPESLSIKCK